MLHEFKKAIKINTLNHTKFNYIIINNEPSLSIQYSEKLQWTVSSILAICTNDISDHKKAGNWTAILNQSFT